MAKHRVSTAQWRKVLAVAVSLMFAGALAASAPATAGTSPIIGHLNTVADDGYDGGACNLNVQGVNENNHTVGMQLSGQSKPVAGNVLGYFQIAHNDITCFVYDPTGTVLLATIHKGANTANVGTTVTFTTVPEYSSYVLCGQVSYTLRSGTLHGFQIPCATGP